MPDGHLVLVDQLCLDPEFRSDAFERHATKLALADPTVAKAARFRSRSLVPSKLAYMPGDFAHMPFEKHSGHHVTPAYNISRRHDVAEGASAADPSEPRFNNC